MYLLDLICDLTVDLKWGFVEWWQTNHYWLGFFVKDEPFDIAFPDIIF